MNNALSVWGRRNVVALLPWVLVASAGCVRAGFGPATDGVDEGDARVQRDQTRSGRIDGSASEPTGDGASLLGDGGGDGARAVDVRGDSRVVARADASLDAAMDSAGSTPSQCETARPVNLSGISAAQVRVDIDTSGAQSPAECCAGQAGVVLELLQLSQSFGIGCNGSGTMQIARADGSCGAELFGCAGQIVCGGGAEVLWGSPAGTVWLAVCRDPAQGAAQLYVRSAGSPTN